jgi:Tol biopolymer transport system component
VIRRSLALAALFLAAAAVTAAACVSKDEPDGTVTPSAAPSGSPTVPPTVPFTAAPAVDAFVLYRDDTGNLVARNMLSGDSYKQTVDYNEQVVVQATCAKDGSRIGYLIQNFSESFRRLDVRGTGAPVEFLQLPANVQVFAWSPDGSQVATAAYDGQTRIGTISVVDVASGEATELWSGPELAGSLDWSPDGSTLVYFVQDLTVGTSKIALMDTTGGDPRDLTSESDIQWYDPAWSPDGSAILAAGIAPEAAQLYSIDAESGEATQLTTDMTIYRRYPRFSPDGSVIAFTGSIVGFPQAAAKALVYHSFGIFTLNPDGSNEQPLTADPRSNPGASVDPYLNAYLLGWCAPGAWLDDAWTLEEASQ